jgi:predicted RNA-binding Zn-ribbon protein involved in translation (DUF1610 family)
MPCETCGHTLQSVLNTTISVWTCPRCGTTKTQQVVSDGTERKIVQDISVPVLVAKVRRLLECVAQEQYGMIF